MSTAKQPFTEQELAELLTKSRHNNEQAGITGMLLYKKLNFMQAVEGPEAAVDDLLRKIGKDPRHFGMVTLLREPIQERTFTDWSMGFVNLDRGAKVPDGFSEIMNEFDPNTFFQNPTLAQKVLAGFRDAL